VTEQDAQLAAVEARTAKQETRLNGHPEGISAILSIIAIKEAAIADGKRQIITMEALLAEREARLVENGALLADRSKRIAGLELEVATLSASIDRAERVIAHIARRFTAAMDKSLVRKLRHAVKVWFYRLSIPTSRYSLVRNSVFFDKNYYLNSNPDVKAGKFDPVVHYLQFGSREGRDPGPQFSEAAYQALSLDVSATLLSALEHYEGHRGKEGRRLLSVGPRLNAPQPNNANPATALTSSGADKTGQNAAPLKIQASRQSLARSGLFDPAAYLEMNEDLRSAGVDPWAHFLSHGLREGRPFTTPRLVARALSQLAADIQEASQEVTERLFGHTGEKDIATAAASLVATNVNIAIYCNSAGNFFFQEIANLVHWQLRALGISSQLRTDESQVDETFDVRIFVAPHEFFWLGRGAEWRHLASARGSVLYNTEQPQTQWFRAAVPYLTQAPLVWDLNLQTAILSRQLGCKSIFFAPPYLPACPYTTPQPDASNIEHLRGYDFSRRPFDWQQNPGLAERPIDILFVGTGCERRLKAIESLRDLTDTHRFLCIYTHQNSPLSDANHHTRSIGIRNLGALAQRTKIVLNIHRDWIGYFEWPRMVMHGLWHGACVVSDPCFPDPTFASGVHFLEESTRHLPELLRWLLGAPDGQRKMNEVAASGYRRAASDQARAAMLVPMLTALQGVAGGPTRR
jgi:hypothetical protein